MYKSRLATHTPATPDTSQDEGADTAAQVNARHALKLRVVRHKYSASIAAHARAMERHTHMLVRLHARIKTQFIAIAGPDYRVPHRLLRRARLHRRAAEGHLHRRRSLGRRPFRCLSGGQRHGQSRRQIRLLRRPAPAPLRVSAAPSPPFAMKPLIQAPRAPPSHCRCVARAFALGFH
jgi:hypothetical protein